MIVLDKNTVSCDDEGMANNEDEEKRYIYFNPNFCINNINVKELVARAEKDGSIIQPTQLTNLVQPAAAQPDQHVFIVPQVPGIKRINKETAPKPDYTFYNITPSQFALPANNGPSAHEVVPSTSKPVQQYKFEEDHNIWDPGHPWYPRNLRYAENLLSLAADYAMRPHEAPICRLPPLSKQELCHRMDMIYKSGNLKTAIKIPSLVDKFVKYMKIVKDQIDFDNLLIDTRNQTYAECREKREKMRWLGVNKYYYINEHAVDEIYERSKIIKQRRIQSMLAPDKSNVDTSKLSVYQRKLIFKQRVFKMGRHRYVKFDDKYRVDGNSPPTLIRVNKYKSVSNAIARARRTPDLRRAQKIRSLRYLRSEDPVHQDCRFYLKTGKCKFGDRCIRKHDSSKLPAALKKKEARSRPKSSFTVNNLPRRPKTKVPPPPTARKPPPLVPISSRTGTASTSLPSATVPAPTTLHKPASRPDYRFISKTALGPKKVGINKKYVNRALNWTRKSAAQKRHDCMFYIRRGKCVFGEKCRKKHDPDKVSLCSRFIFANNCFNPECPYQHKLIREKMPICLYFFAGKCTKEECPFLHVKMGLDVAICDKFLKGHCDKGSSCTKRHTRDCEIYFESGLCTDLDCKLLHEKYLRSRACSFSSIENVLPDTDRPYFDGDDFIPIGNIEDSFSPDILRMLDSDTESILSESLS